MGRVFAVQMSGTESGPQHLCKETEHGSMCL